MSRFPPTVRRIIELPYHALMWVVDLLVLPEGEEEEDLPRWTRAPEMDVEEPEGLGGFRRKHPWVKDLALIASIPAAIIVFNWLVAPDGADAGDRSVAEALPSAARPSKALIPVTPVDNDAPAGSEVVLAVRLSGDRALPLPDSLVSWRVVGSSGARLEHDTVRTNAAGEALNTLRLPAEPGRVMIVANSRVANPPQVRFEVRAVSAGQARIQTVRGDGQRGPLGGVLGEPVRVRLVTEPGGDPLPGAVVRFQVMSGQGRVEPRVAVTDARGLAEALWRLGPLPGPQQLEAVVPRADDSTVVFVATAEGTPELAGEPLVGDPALEGPGVGVAIAPAADTANGGVAEDSAAGAAAAEEPPPPAAPVEEPRPRAPPPVSVVRETYTLGGGHVCRLATGNAVCRGANDRGQVAAQGAAGLVALAAGLSHTCGLSDAGVAYCWGANDRGQLGDGALTDRRQAGAVRTEARFTALAAGVTHTCGLASTGQAYCWGGNINGQLGDGSRDDRGQPRPVAGGTAFRRITAGWSHTCALDQSGNAHCWGLNSEGQLGDGSRLDRLAPRRVAGGFSTLAAGSAHTCGLRQGRVLCWGDNRFGQLGDGTTEDRPSPAEVRGLPSPAVRLAVGAVHSCALVEDGTAYCWGQNLRGQLGDGTTESRATPVRVSGEQRFRTLEAGGAITCGNGTDGNEYCWGHNQNGQLGDGTRVDQSVPTRVRR